MFSRIDMISFPFFCHRGNSHIPISLIIILHTELILFFFHDYQTKYRDMMPPRYNCYLFSYFQQSVSVLPYLLVGLMDRSLFKADRSLFCTSSPPFFTLSPFFLSMIDPLVFFPSVVFWGMQKELLLVIRDLHYSGCLSRHFPSLVCT